jgi:lysophospholipase L1-like esterase
MDDISPIPDHFPSFTDPGPTAESGRARSPSRRRLLDALLIVSLALNVLGGAAVAGWVVRQGGIHYLLARLDLRDAKQTPAPFQVDQLARLRMLPDTEGEIIFAGDSLVADGPWAELFSTIKNRGIGGEMTSGLLGRLDEITGRRPRKIFLLIGTNCLAVDLPVAQVVRNYREILGRIRAESPQTRVFVLSVLPVNRHLPQKPTQQNATIRDLNRRLRDLVGEFEGVTFVDVFDALADARGDLRNDLTTDGIHLNIDGYLILGRLLNEHVVDEVK